MTYLNAGTQTDAGQLSADHGRPSLSASEIRNIYKDLVVFGAAVGW